MKIRNESQPMALFVILMALPFGSQKEVQD